MEAVQDNQNILGGPLKLRLCPPLAFSGFVPGPDELVEEIKGFIHDCVLYPPWELPPGEIKFFGRQFGYKAIVHTVSRRRLGWFRALMEPWRIGESAREEFWHCEDAATYLAECFAEEWGWLIEEEKPAPPAPVAAPVLALPAVVAPAVKLSSRRRGLLQMAAEMEMDANALEAQLDSGAYNYIVSLLVECQSMVKTGDGYGTYQVRREYLFDKADAEHNINHRNEPGEITVKKKEMGK